MVTGSAGYVGKNLVKHLKDLEHEVFEYDLSLNKQQDILQPNSIRQAMQGCDMVYNCAAIPNVTYVRKNPIRGELINVIGARIVATIATELQVKPVLFSTYYQVMELNTEYGRQKKQMEAENQKIAVILRLGNVYGGIGYDAKYGVLQHFYQDTPIILHESTQEQQRDFVHMSQVMKACETAMDLPFGVHNVMSGVMIPIKTLALIFGAVRNVEVETGKCQVKKN
jgi:nucleoside-diphosphate-sugar epimerase